MTDMLIILNPNAGSGRAQHVWQTVEPILTGNDNNLTVIITEHPGDVLQHVEQAYLRGIRQVISVGGDGTNNSVVSAVAKLRQATPNADPITIGNLPVGTGRDWARSQGIPLKATEAAKKILRATPTPVDLGEIRFDSGKTRYFLNIASGGMGGDVDMFVNNVQQRRPWTFLQATINAILTHKPQRLKITLDDTPWFDHQTMLVVVANGTTFGHGMKIAPHASTDDGLFDVVALETTSRAYILRTLWQVYTGSHLRQKGVLFKQARKVEIIAEDYPLPLDIDGEYGEGQRLTLEVKPRFINMLI